MVSKHDVAFELRSIKQSEVLVVIELERRAMLEEVAARHSLARVAHTITLASRGELTSRS